MNSKIISFEDSDASIAYASRKTTVGPEAELVTSFLRDGMEGKGYSFKSEHMAVFIEPRIDSGFPDIVIAEYRPEFFESWRIARNELSSMDLKLLSYLYGTKGADSSQIHNQLRLRDSVILKSTELLLDADLIVRDKERRLWLPKPIEATFGLNRLIAVEAKVCNNQDVLNQAALNCWFASESYALTPIIPSDEFARSARDAGVGVVAGNFRRNFRRFIKPRSLPLPSSYASWQFNEWIGKRLTKGGM